MKDVKTLFRQFDIFIMYDIYFTDSLMSSRVPPAEDSRVPAS